MVKEVATEVPLVAMSFNEQLLNEWILAAGTSIMVLLYQSGSTGAVTVTPRVGLMSGLLSLVVVNAVVLLTIRARNQRMGLSTPRSLVLGAVTASVLSAGGF